MHTNCKKDTYSRNTHNARDSRVNSQLELSSHDVKSLRLFTCSGNMALFPAFAGLASKKVDEPPKGKNHMSCL